MRRNLRLIGGILLFIVYVFLWVPLFLLFMPNGNFILGLVNILTLAGAGYGTCRLIVDFTEYKQGMEAK
jgi:hypothetical protein